jgi:hypothetical protein
MATCSWLILYACILKKRVFLDKGERGSGMQEPLLSIHRVEKVSYKFQERYPRSILFAAFIFLPTISICYVWPGLNAFLGEEEVQQPFLLSGTILALFVAIAMLLALVLPRIREKYPVNLLYSLPGASRSAYQILRICGVFAIILDLVVVIEAILMPNRFQAIPVASGIILSFVAFWPYIRFLFRWVQTHLYLVYRRIRYKKPYIFEITLANAKNDLQSKQDDSKGSERTP